MSCMKLSPHPTRSSISLTATQHGLTLCSDEQFSTFTLDPFSLHSHSNLSAFSLGVALESGRVVLSGRPESNSESNLYLWERGEVLKEIVMPSKVIGLTSCGREVLVLLQFKAILLSENLELLRQFSTSDNTHSLGVITADCVCLPDISPGTLSIYHLRRTSPLLISAHNHVLRSLAMSPDGSLVVTASECGTLLRIFNSETGICLKQLRVGVRENIVTSLAISHDNRWLAASSSLHLYIFDLESSPGMFSFIPSYSHCHSLADCGKLVFTDHKTLQVITARECLTFTVRLNLVQCTSRHALTTLAEEWVLLD